MAIGDIGGVLGIWNLGRDVWAGDTSVFALAVSTTRAAWCTLRLVALPRGSSVWLDSGTRCGGVVVFFAAAAVVVVGDPWRCFLGNPCVPLCG